MEETHLEHRRGVVTQYREQTRVGVNGHVGCRDGGGVRSALWCGWRGNRDLTQWRCVQLGMEGCPHITLAAYRSWRGLFGTDGSGLRNHSPTRVEITKQKLADIVYRLPAIRGYPPSGFTPRL